MMSLHEESFGWGKDKLHFRNEFLRAMKNGNIEPWYQPVFMTDTKQYIGAEILARWRRGDGHLIPPAEFISRVEESGLVVEMTRALMTQVVAEVKDIIHCLPQPFRISFNFTAEHISQPSFKEECLQFIQAFPEKAVQLVIEITEKEIPEQVLALAGRLSVLREAGIHIAVDDFGTGFSNLNYINQLPVSLIKIDRSFISQVDCEVKPRYIIDFIGELASELQMDLLAEGVETKEQFNYLTAKGIRLFQGYYFSPPLPAQEFIRAVAGETIKTHNYLVR